MEAGESVFEPDVNASMPPDDMPAEDEAKPKRIKIRISLFFDGTQNNRYNTAHRLLTEKPLAYLTAEERSKRAESERIMKEHGQDASSSYYNDYSNVARLEKHIDKDTAPGYDHYLKVYTDGIGTVDSESDSFYGYLTGKGDTGVEAKVDIGLSSALRALTKLWEAKYARTPAVIERLSVDTFGFSRGAAAARHCAYRVLHCKEQPYPKPMKHALRERIKARGIDVEAVEVRTVGVYDTVSSIGVAYIDLSDVPTLKLDSVREAKAVLHLAAAEEYRICFSLTNIDSATSAGVGVEIFLPGAHSDIGGGYPDAGKEDQLICSGRVSATIAEYLRDHGWYTDEELRYVNLDMGRTRIENVSARRFGISNEYSYIPLRIMADFSREQELLLKEKLYDEFDPINVPSALRERLEAYAQAKRGKGQSKSSDWQANDPELRSLRHDFLHFSGKDSMGHHLRTMRIGKRFEERPTRKVFPG